MAIAPKKATVDRVVLKAAYSGERVALPGEVIEVSADEAERLIGLGAAIRAGDDK